jgi:hypothetical protein
MLKDVSKTHVLIGLTLLWVGLIVWILVPSSSNSLQTAPSGATSRQSNQRMSMLDRLEKRRHQADKLVVARNIFAPVHATVTAAVAQSANPLASPIRNGKGVRDRKIAHATTVSQATEEARLKELSRQQFSAFRYLGYVRRDGKEEAVLARGEELHIVKSGDILGEKIQVKAIAPGRVTLRHVGTDDEHLVPLEGENL